MEDKYLQTKGSNGNETITIAKKRHTSKCEETTTEYVEGEQMLDESNEKLTNETRHDIKKTRKLYGRYGRPIRPTTTPCLTRKKQCVDVNQYYF